MIVGQSFVWLHFPKTGGHTVAAAIQAAARGRLDLAFDDEVADADGWHDTLARRMQRDAGFDPTGKVVISGVRRLPWWLLSRVHYEASRRPFHCASREMLCRGEFYENNGRVNQADAYMTQFSGEPVDRWLRLENMAEDFISHFEGLLGPRVRTAARKLRKAVNATRLDYVKSLDFYFTPKELDALYEANPAWAIMEERIYGDTLRL